MCKPNLLFVSIALVLASSAFACGGSPPVTPGVPSTSAQPSEIPDDGAAPQISSIEVYSKDGTEILVDGKSIGKAPIAKYEVTPGAHDVTFVDPDTGNRTMSINVAAGDHQVVTSDPTPSANDSMRPDATKPKKGK